MPSTAACKCKPHGSRCPTAKPGYLWREFAAARSKLLRRWPDAAARGSDELNRTALALQLRREMSPHAAGLGVLAELVRLVLPHRDAACGDGWGWDYMNRGKGFEQVMEEQLGAFVRIDKGFLRRGARGGSGGARVVSRRNCTLPPQAALHMGLDELTEYVLARGCTSVWKFSYAANSVPVFQLALFLRSFPKAMWTFVRYEQLLRGGPGNMRLLASRLGVDLDEGAPSCRFKRQRGSSRVSFVKHDERAARPSFDHNRVGALFAPWHQALVALAEQSRATLIGWNDSVMV